MVIKDVVDASMTNLSQISQNVKAGWYRNSVFRINPNFLLVRVRGNIAHTAGKIGKKPEDIIMVKATKIVHPERIWEAIRTNGDIIGKNKV
jgi:hypothetical protein